MPSPLPTNLLEKLLPALIPLAEQIKSHGIRSLDQLTQLMLSCGVNHESALNELQTWTLLLNQVRSTNDPDKKKAAVKNLLDRGIPNNEAQKSIDIVSATTTISPAGRKPTNIKVLPGRLDFGVLSPGETSQKQIEVSGGPGKAIVSSPILRVEPVEFGPEPTTLTVYLQGGMGGTTLQEQVILEAEGVSRVRIEVTGRWTAVVPTVHRSPVKSPPPGAPVGKSNIFDVQQVWNTPPAPLSEATTDPRIEEAATLKKQYDEIYHQIEELRNDLFQQGKGLESNDALQYKRLLDLEARINELQAGIESLEDRLQIESLKTGIAELHRLLDSRFQHLNMGYRELERNIQPVLEAQVVPKISEFNEKLYNLQSGLASQISEIRSQSTHLSYQFEELVQQQSVNLEAYRREKEQFRQQQQETETSFAALRETVTEFTEHREKLENQITQVSARLTSESSQLTQELGDLQRKTALLDEACASTVQGVDSLIEQQSQIQSDLQSIGIHVKELMEKQESRDASQEDRLQELEQSLLPRIEAHTAERLQEIDSQIQTIQGEINSLKQVSQEMLATLQSVMASIQRLEKAQATTPGGTAAAPVVTTPSTTHSAPRPAWSGDTAAASPRGGEKPSSPIHERVTSPRPVTPARSLAWMEDWRRLNAQMDRLKNQPLSPTLKKDIERLDSYYRVLVKQWDTLKTPSDDPAMWTEWLLDSLDYHLYQSPQIVSLNEALPHDVRALLEDIQLVIQNAQMDRQRELRERLGLERIEGVVGQDKPVAYIIEPDPDYPPAETTENRIDGTFCRIVPGHGGYRHQGKVLRKSLAIFYRYAPSSEGAI